MAFVTLIGVIARAASIVAARRRSLAVLDNLGAFGRFVTTLAQVGVLVPQFGILQALEVFLEQRSIDPVEVVVDRPVGP